MIMEADEPKVCSRQPGDPGEPLPQYKFQAKLSGLRPRKGRSFSLSPMRDKTDVQPEAVRERSSLVPGMGGGATFFVSFRPELVG